MFQKFSSNPVLLSYFARILEEKKNKIKNKKAIQLPHCFLKKQGLWQQGPECLAAKLLATHWTPVSLGTGLSVPM